jgi:hypothetical protein
MNENGQAIINKIKQIEESAGLDWRFSYHSLHVERTGEARVELSRKEVFDALADGPYESMRTGEGSLLLTDGASRVKVELLRPPEGEALWVTSSVADLRKSPDHASELLNQMIMGEAAERLKAEGDWFLARLPDGYIGWIRSWYVRESARDKIAAFMDRAGMRVEANVAYVRSSPGEEGPPVSDIVAGSRVEAGPSESGYRGVTLPGGRSGFMRGSELGGIGGESAPSREGIISRAERYLGIPYLWGGTSPKGFDCSGLVKRVFSQEGIELPRDSDRQALMGSEIRVGETEPGDLLFFGDGETISHVAISLGGSRFIHAYGEVRINSLDAKDPLFDDKLADSVRFARTNFH